MLHWARVSDLQLDIVGIVAVLGEGSTSRNAQASALGWHHILPRLLPAPQALLKHEHAKRLPTVSGTVVGAYSGNIKFELNFFCQLLHDDKLAKNQVELVKVKRRKRSNGHTNLKDSTGSQQLGHAKADETEAGKSDTGSHNISGATIPAYGLKPMCPLVFLSVFGCCAAMFMAGFSVVKKDGFALLATLMLSLNSSLVGFASWWRLDIREDMPQTTPQQNRAHTIPDSDVVIYYPRQGAFRIVRCEESVSRLYFKTETCEQTFGDNTYRVLALMASILLMLGLLCMGNATNSLKLAFAATYILLNALWWSFSAFNPVGRMGHWQHEYDCEIIKVLAPPKGCVLHSILVGSSTNMPSLVQQPQSLVEENVRTTSSPLSMSPTENGSSFQNIDLINTPQIRRRRNSTSWDKRLSAEPAIECKTRQVTISEPTHSEHSPPTQLPLTIAVSVPNSTRSDQSRTRRQNTHDLEGQRTRLLKPLGSAWLMVEKWLDRNRLISRPPSRTPTQNLDESERPDTFTTALWKAIAVTGSARWLRQTHIAPDNAVWSAWIEEAQKRAEAFGNVHGERVAAYTTDEDGHVILPPWDYQGRLGALFQKESDLRKRRPPAASRLATVVTELRLQGKLTKVKGITPAIEFKLRRRARAAKRVVKQKKKDIQRVNTMLDLDHNSSQSRLEPTDTVIRDLARRKTHS